MTTSDMTQHAAGPEDPGEAEFARRFPPGHPIHKDIRAAINRSYSDIFSFWCLCDRPACRRSGCCKGNPSHCCDLFRPLLPDDVHDAALPCSRAGTKASASTSCGRAIPTNSRPGTTGRRASSNAPARRASACRGKRRPPTRDCAGRDEILDEPTGRRESRRRISGA